MSRADTATRWMFRFVWTVLITGVAVLVLSGLESRRSTRNRANLKQIMLALHEYHDRYLCFPPAYVLDSAGRPAHSWRVLLLPFLGRNDLYSRYRFDEPWDGPNNKSLLSEIPDVYQWPWEGRTGDTHYSAIVGSQTMWPGHISTKYAEIFDGASNTWSVLETAAGLRWISPDDVRLTDVKRKELRIVRGGILTVPSFLAAFADGTVREETKALDWHWVHTYCTAMGGIPHPALGGRGLSFESSDAEFLAFDDRPLANTDLQPTLRWPLRKERNVLYCSTMQIALQNRSRQTKTTVSGIVGDSPLARAFAVDAFAESNLDSSSYIAETGSNGPELDRRIRDAIREKFPTSKVPYDGPKGATYSFCYLQKRLPFAAYFERSPKPLRFRHSGGTTDVQAFGCLKSGDQSPHWQVRVVSYSGPDDFVIRIQTDARRNDVITLAKIPPSSTLADTWKEAVDRETTAPGLRRPGLEKDEVMLVPNLALSVVRDHTELTSNGSKLDFAVQAVRFRLDEKGALLESFAEPYDAIEDEIQPRQFILDRPFLLALTEKKAIQPYFVLWVANPEVMETFSSP